MTEQNTFAPDYAVHPGNYLAEVLAARNIEKNEFAARAGISAKTVSQIIGGHEPLTTANALAFARVLDMSAQLWCNLSMRYLLWQSEQRRREIEAADRAWLKNFPLQELRRRKVLTEKRADDLDNLLRFLGVKSPRQFADVYAGLEFAARQTREASRASRYALICWFRFCERAAENAATEPYRSDRFQEAVLEVVVNKTIGAALDRGEDKIVVAGGVAANSRLREMLRAEADKHGLGLYYPPPILCTDNAAMIGCAAYYKYMAGEVSGLDLDAIPNLEL